MIEFLNQGTQIKWQQIFARIRPQIFRYIHGFAITNLILLAAKKFIGGLRPYFFEACMPSFNCDLATDNTYVWPGEYECTNTDGGYDYSGTDPSTINLYNSFFSGHAAMISLSMIYLIVS